MTNRPNGALYTGVTSDIGSNEETAYCRSDGAF